MPKEAVSYVDQQATANHSLSGCQCFECRSACEHKPGWYLPGQAEKTAEAMGLSLKDFFDKYLAVDWFTSDDDRNIFVLAPALVGKRTGHEYPGYPCGTCVFFKEGLCGIHSTKPHECAALTCAKKESRGVSQERHESVAMQWDKPEHQQQIRQLLGRDPEASDWAGGIFSLFSGGLYE